jgi:hypothetical protein
MDNLETPIANRSRRSILVPMLLWLVFGAGLSVQAFSPHLPIEHNSFVISADVVPAGSVLDPRALINRQRLMQAISAMLVLVGAAGLAIWYREALSRSLTRRGA